MAKIHIRKAGLFLTSILLGVAALQGQTIIENFPGVSFSDDLSLGQNLTPPDTMDWIDRNLVMLRGNAEEKRERGQIPIESRVEPLKLVCLLIEPV